MNNCWLADKILFIETTPGKCEVVRYKDGKEEALQIWIPNSERLVTFWNTRKSGWWPQVYSYDKVQRIFNEWIPCPDGTHMMPYRYEPHICHEYGNYHIQRYLDNGKKEAWGGSSIRWNPSKNGHYLVFHTREEALARMESDILKIEYIASLKP